MTSIVSAKLPVAVTLIKNPPTILWELIFRRDLKQKSAPPGQ